MIPNQFLSQHQTALESAELLGKGIYHTESYSKLVEELKQNKERNRELYALVGLVTTVAFAIFFGFAVAPIAGWAMGICCMIPLAYLLKVESDISEQRNRLKIELSSLSTIYGNMANHFTNRYNEFGVNLNKKMETVVRLDLPRPSKQNYDQHQTELRKALRESDTEHKQRYPRDTALAKHIAGKSNPIEPTLGPLCDSLSMLRPRLKFTSWDILHKVCNDSTKYNLQRL